MTTNRVRSSRPRRATGWLTLICRPGAHHHDRGESCRLHGPRRHRQVAPAPRGRSVRDLAPLGPVPRRGCGRKRLEHRDRGQARQRHQVIRRLKCLRRGKRHQPLQRPEARDCLRQPGRHDAVWLRTEPSATYSKRRFTGILWARLVSNQRPLACEATCHPTRKHPFCLQMLPMCRDRGKPSFTEFACVSRGFGPLEAASGPFNDAHRGRRGGRWRGSERVAARGARLLS